MSSGKGKIISNPYARKRKDPPSAAAASSGRAAGSTFAATATSVTMPDFGGASAPTFSQAFESIEHTSHYKTQMKSAPLDPKTEKERAQQRAIDLHEATAAVQEKQKALSDKDHHVLLQPHVLYVSTKQRGNAILKYIRNVPFAISKMVPDYIMSTTCCALFLSIKYHQLYPEYIHRRLGELKRDFKLRVLLVLVDVDDNKNALLFLNKLAVVNNLTLILAWTEQEAARYLETYKALDGKDASSIQKREQTNFVDQVADFFTAAKPVNKTDAANLVSHLSTVKSVLTASKDELALCPGLGNIKVHKLHDALHKPFSKQAAAKRKKQRLEEEQKTEQAKDAQPALSSGTDGEHQTVEQKDSI